MTLYTTNNSCSNYAVCSSSYFSSSAKPNCCGRRTIDPGRQCPSCPFR
ncbi:MAG TPA: hypothetical protein VJC39_05010 [Candidatus Nanoarchaeia archaeon]|nr:hypothetical protein [Candidatus Nanoarchaeia archaeon]